MRKVLPFALLAIVCSTLQAQYKVRFVVKEQTAIRHDSIYITGTFNNWDSIANNANLMHSDASGAKSIELNLKGGLIRYKFTRGSWSTVEKEYTGEEVADRIVLINKDTTLMDSVLNWRDVTLTDKTYALLQSPADTDKIRIFAAIASIYAFIPDLYNNDSALYYAQKAVTLTRKLLSSDEYNGSNAPELNRSFIKVQELTAVLLNSLGNYPQALAIRFETLKLAEEGKDKFAIVQMMSNITSDYASMKDYGKVLSYGIAMDSVVKTFDTSDRKYHYARWLARQSIATAYFHLHKLDSALYYANNLEIFNDFPYNKAINFSILADIYSEQGNDSLAFAFYRQAVANDIVSYFFVGAAKAHEGMAKIFKRQNQIDSALYYARLALTYYQNNRRNAQAWGEDPALDIAEICPLIAELYKAKGNAEQAYYYLKLSVSLKDSLYDFDKIRQFQGLTYGEMARRQQVEQDRKEAQQRFQTRLEIYSLVAIMAVGFLIAFIFYRNNKQKQKANIILQEQKQKVEATLSKLESTQAQLIQSEKMASLGELTAGVAHEIQNPLNFVNNFSEVTNELIDEMREELSKGNINEANAIADDIKQNLEKINHHGKRADSIVKGMLQHSRQTKGVMTPTDINALCDEYLRLSYHGLRAKDKTFNSEFKSDFDENLGNINVVPQDIGRALLNLFNNAFYAVAARQKREPHSFRPLVDVSTEKKDGSVEIIVCDNGSGIPADIIDKVFQPFFTTKPAGQGTGLGLSLAYDIVTKEHGGTIKVQSHEGEGTQFTIEIPDAKM